MIGFYTYRQTPPGSRFSVFQASALTLLLLLAACTTPQPVDGIAQDAWAIAREEKRQQVAELVVRARTARDQGRRSEARNLLKEAVMLDAANGAAQHLLGLCYFEDGDLYNAAMHLDTASRLLSDRFEPCYNLGCVLEAGGQYEQAIHRYQQSLSRRRNHLSTLENLGRVRLKAGYHDQETLRILNRCVDHEKRLDWTAWLEREVVRLRSRLDKDGSSVSLTRRVQDERAEGLEPPSENVE